MNEFELGIIHLNEWFNRHDISTDSITVVLDVADRRVAATIDAYMRHDIQDNLKFISGGPFRSNQLTINGLKVRLQSPLHPKELL